MNTDYSTQIKKAEAVILCVNTSGLEPLQAPKVLPPIVKEDVRRVVWAVISAK